MIKRMILTSLIVTFTVTCLFAQGLVKTGGFARLTGMGGNPYVMDPFFNTINPAWNSVYDNFILGDLGSAAGSPFSAGGFGQYLSGSFRVGQNWTLGGILARNDFNGMSIALLDPGSNNSLGIPFPGVVSSVNLVRGPGSVVPLDNNVELIGTYSFGNTALGLGIAYASTTNDFTPATGTSSEGAASQLGFNIGIVSVITSGITSTGSSDLPSFSSIGAGGGLNYQVGDFLLAGGVLFSTNSLTFASTSTSPELSNTATIFPIWNFGVEWSLLDWLVGRFGYVAFTGSLSQEQVGATTTSVDEFVNTFFTPPQRGATLGVGFRFGDFSLDATVNEDVLRQGFNVVGGGGASFAYLTASYAMP